MNDTIARAEDLNNKAKNLIANYPLKQLAEKHFGNITFTGSYTFNCMANADIDSNIILNPIDKTRIISFVDELTEIKECRKISLYNRSYEDPPYFIVNVERFLYEDESFTITFFIEEEDFRGAVKKSEDLKKVITSETKTTILEIKNWRIENGLKKEIPSVWIYEAVLERDVDTIEKFKQFVKSKQF